MLFQEGVDTFDKFIPLPKQAKAQRAFLDKSKTQDGQKEILALARGGDPTAADFIFSTLRKVIAKAYWKYYLGPNTRFHSQRVSSGSAQDFASKAYEMVMGANDPSPYDTFNPAKFTANSDLIKQFGYYLFRYLQSEAFKMIRSEKMGGMTGNVDQGTPVETVGYEGHFENDDTTSVSDSFTGDVEVNMTVEGFKKVLKKENLTFYKIFDLKSKGFSTMEVAQKLGISDQSVRNHLKVIRSMWEQFTA